MSIAKPFTFTANTYAKASEVNADFDIVYSQVNTNISNIAQNATDIDNLENNKADINGSSSQRFAVADAITSSDAINKQTLFKAIGNSVDYISGLVITKDSGSPNDTIIVSEGSCYDSTHAVVLSLDSSLSKQNLNQGASSTYYVYIIGNSSGNQTDILISTEQLTPALPTGYSLFRQIGNYTTDSSSNIYQINMLSSNISHIYKDIDDILYYMAPDYSKGISIADSTNYIATTNGWVFAVQHANNYSGIMNLNGEMYTTIMEDGDSSINQATMIYLAKGQYFGATRLSGAKFYPCIGRK